MSDVKHTPGPWERTSDPYDDGTPYQKIIAGPDRGLYDDDTQSGFNLTFIGTDADGALIEAAPDMLAALKCALHDYTLSDPAAQVVEAAIAKAEGRSQ